MAVPQFGPDFPGNAAGVLRIGEEAADRAISLFGVLARFFRAFPGPHAVLVRRDSGERGAQLQLRPEEIDPVLIGGGLQAGFQIGQVLV